MAITFPDISQHNNPLNAGWDADFVRGGGRTVADTAALYALAPNVDQLKQNVTEVYVTALGYKLRLTDISNVGNSTGWTALNPADPARITQDSTHRFATDTEKTSWNSKQAALGYAPENPANKGATNGYASLDGSGLIPASQWPAGIDKILEYANFVAFPATGAANTIYLAIDTLKQYRWGGSVYAVIDASAGTTDALTEGSTNLYFTAARVLAILLTGLSTATSAVISATDSILVALGKLQAQISANVAAIAAKVAQTTTVNGHALSTNVIVTASDVGLGSVPNTDATVASNITQDATHRFATDTEKSTWNGKQAALTFDTTVTSGSSNPPTSGAVYTAVSNLNHYSLAFSNPATQFQDYFKNAAAIKTILLKSNVATYQYSTNGGTSWTTPSLPLPSNISITADTIVTHKITYTAGFVTALVYIELA